MSRYRKTSLGLVVALLVAVGVAVVSVRHDAQGSSSDTPSRLRVVATTTIIADLAREVASGRADVWSMQPANADVHTFEPTPRDVARVAKADLLLENGLGLDAWIGDIARKSGTRATIVTVTDGIVPLEDAELDDEHHVTDHHGHEHAGHDDPHVWLDVANAKIMVAAIRDALITADPAGREVYARQAEAYTAELTTLDEWIREQVTTLPPDQRKMVTNHDAFGYYVQAYGLDLVGSIIPGLDSQSQPSARQTAALVAEIRAQHVKAIFTEASLNPKLAQRIAEEAGVLVVDGLYADALGPAGSGADTYIGMMRTDTTLIVEALQ